MAQDQQTANAGTEGATSATPTWDSFDKELYPFLNLNEELKRAGFKVTFLSDKPKRETPNRLEKGDTDFWFDVVFDGEPYTWTFSQKSLVMELQKHKPLKDKTFLIKLVAIDEAFKKQFPKYKGKDRYAVTPLDIQAAKPTVTKTTGINEAATEPTIEEEEVKEA